MKTINKRRFIVISIYLFTVILSNLLFERITVRIIVAIINFLVGTLFLIFPKCYNWIIPDINKLKKTIIIICLYFNFTSILINLLNL